MAAPVLEPYSTLRRLRATQGSSQLALLVRKGIVLLRRVDVRML